MNQSHNVSSLTVRKPYKRPFLTAKRVIAGVAAFLILLALAVTGLLVMTGHQHHLTSTTLRFVPQPPAKVAIKTDPNPASVVVHGTTTAAICKQLGSQDTMGGTPDADLGIVDESECLIGNVIYTVSKFENKTYRDSWIAGEKKLGIFTKWQGDDWSAVWYDPSAASNFSS